MRNVLWFVFLSVALSVSAAAEVTIERIGGEAPASVSEEGNTRVVVGSGVYLLHAVASELARDTRIEARYHKVHGAAGWEDFEAWCREQQPPLSAVLGVSAASVKDESAARARAANIRTIPIDASRPLDGKGAGVALIAGGRDTEFVLTPDYRFGFSLENLSRMAEIVAADLSRLSPEDAATIARNLGSMKGDLNGLGRLAALEGGKAVRTEVADPGEVFPYLIQSLGLTRVAADTPHVPVLAALPSAAPGQVALHLLDDTKQSAEGAWANVVSQYRENIENIFAALRQP